MGYDDGESDEKPAHTVYLNAFYIDKYEITNALYQTCVDSSECDFPSNVDQFNDPRFAEHPVVYINWIMAKTYCEWRGDRLPTEAEWEKAARGADSRTYPWGEDIGKTYANYDSNISTEVGKFKTVKVYYGAYDMAGNAWEWVADWYREIYYETLSNGYKIHRDQIGYYRVFAGLLEKHLLCNARARLTLSNVPICISRLYWLSVCAR